MQKNWTLISFIKCKILFRIKFSQNSTNFFLFLRIFIINKNKHFFYLFLNDEHSSFKTTLNKLTVNSLKRFFLSLWCFSWNIFYQIKLPSQIKWIYKTLSYSYMSYKYMSLINIYLYLNRFIHNYRLIKVSNVSHETNLISSIYFNPYFHISLNCFHNSTNQPNHSFIQ